MPSVIVTSLKCPKCGDIIYSRARHDFRSCSCEAVAIDGGFDYTRIIGNDCPKTEILVVDGADKQMLYDDWNKRIDKFGLIKKENQVSERKSDVKINRRTKGPKKRTKAVKAKK